MMTDVLVIGSGAAGLTAALHLADKGVHVSILCKSTLDESSTLYAQGGIAAVFDDQDSIEAHVQDTLNAGGRLCDEDAVRFVVSKGRSAVEWLIDRGVEFTHDLDAFGEKQYHLNQEGGHSHRRILHSKDRTGHSLQSTLGQHILSHPHIQILSHRTAIDVCVKKGTCYGAYVFNQSTASVEAYHAKAVILATGGASRVYLYSSNPQVSSGDGIAMAWRAGCRVANMEFNQFHPTCLYHSEAGSFLITEAMRGEGAILRLPDGTAFMKNFDPRGELAPRDIVAQAIDHEMKRLGLDCVYLDITHKPAKFIHEHFPTIVERCATFGIDITREWMPVVPAAHYTCGGVCVSQHGLTDVEGLYACGEVTYTGLHGANRMASNSLLECIVYAISAAEHIHDNLPEEPPFHAPRPWNDQGLEDSPEAVYVSYNWEEVRRCMWHFMGIVRSNQRLSRALARISMLKHEVQDYYAHFKLTRDLIELRNLVVVAELMIRSALMRKESRGLHVTLDYPEADVVQVKPTILMPSAARTYSVRSEMLDACLN